MVKRKENRIKGNNWDKTWDVSDKQLIKIPSQKIISLLFFPFFCKNENIVVCLFVFFNVRCMCPFKNYSTNESSLKYIYSCTIGLASEFMKKKKKKKKISASFYIKKASLQIWVKKGHNKQYKKKIERQRLLMRFLKIRLLFNGLFHYFGQLQAVDFIRKGSSCNDKAGR